MRLLFRAAVKHGLLKVSPCVWDADDLPTKRDADPAWRLNAGFGLEEVRQLIASPKIPEIRRVLYGLEFLTGLRMGEVAMRRWKDWDPTVKPLGRLTAATAWNSRARVEKGTKTETVKLVPVHPMLGAMLAAWKDGWARTFGRAPGDDDLIVPAERGEPLCNSVSWRNFQTDLDALGLDPQRHYESRSTFRSLALAGGADERMLDLITHPPSPNSGEAKRAYDRRLLLWPKLCEAVLALKFGSPPKRARVTLTVTDTVTVTGSAATRITENVRRFTMLGEKMGGGRARESNPPAAPLSTTHRF